MRCHSCSAEMPEGSRFCATCGTPLSVADTPTQTSAVETRFAGPPLKSATGPTRLHSASVSLSSSLPESRFIPGSVLAGRYCIIGLLG